MESAAAPPASTARRSNALPMSLGCHANLPCCSCYAVFLNCCRHAALDCRADDLVSASPAAASPPGRPAPAPCRGGALDLRRVVVARQRSAASASPAMIGLHDRLMLGDDLVEIHDQGVGADDVVPHLLLEQLILVDQPLMAGDRRRSSCAAPDRRPRPGRAASTRPRRPGARTLPSARATQSGVRCCGRQPRRHAFQAAAQRVELPRIGVGEFRHHPLGVGDLLDQPFMGQRAQRRAQRAAADFQLRRPGRFR